MRTRRICLANEPLPPRLRLLVLSLSVILVAGFAVMKVANLRIPALMLVSIAGSRSSCRGKMFDRNVSFFDSNKRRLWDLFPVIGQIVEGLRQHDDGIVWQRFKPI